MIQANPAELRDSHPLEDLLAIARALGWGAAKILRAYYRGEPFQDGTARNLDIQNEKDGPVTAADLAVNSFVLGRLHDLLGGEQFGYLSEETYKSQASAAPFPQDWVWILDPLDGTRDFIDKTGEYAFHLALAYRGRPVLSVVTCPELERQYFATLGGGAFVETPDGKVERLQVSACDRPADLVVVVSRTHRDGRLNALLQKLPCQNQLSVGSVGGKVAALVDRRADLYISLSGKSAPKDWDMAAPELILTEAGGKFTHFNGEPLRYNTGDVNQWGGLMASNGCCHEALCAEATRILAEIDGLS
ncbi:3'(2'),5'-bisphosphate nucleotidase CysQ [Leptolyngbya sp. O-77]|uniref:3'(2'),5'-bisphosphate nucleotidase CysQ family protein n=1 Tax=Leptolyngbya sp. O-77 TaxID=1080068 RepID=UPI00074D4082|nr:inositol monophosphatase family protein [Leptolyngbya sp. O-77]BAU44464.1 3'(2'),5'-bisphosphate nucleotidase CysQ [Leptolyngbya sp. O-77]